MSRSDSIITEPIKGVYETPPIPTDLLEQIRASHINYKRRQAQVIHVLSYSPAVQASQSDTSSPGHASASHSILLQIWYESSSWHRIYGELCQPLGSSDLERLARLQARLNELSAPITIHHPCSCMGRVPSPTCPWAFVKSLYSRLYAAFLVDCLRQQDRDLIAAALALFLTNLDLSDRAQAQCSAATPDRESESPAICALLADIKPQAPSRFVQAVLWGEFPEGQLPDDILALLFDIVVERRQYRQISLLCWSIAMVPVDSQKTNRIIAQLTDRLCSKPDCQQLAYWTAWSSWQIYISRACIAATMSLGELQNPFEIAQENSTVIDETPADTVRRRIFSLLALSLAINYRVCIGAVGKGPTGSTFLNWILQWIRIHKSNYRWDRVTYWIVHATLYQLIHRLSIDWTSLKECFSERFPLLINVLALSTAVEDFVYFSPISFEDESKAEFDSHQAYMKLKREIRLDKEFRTGDIGTLDKEFRTGDLGTELSAAKEDMAIFEASSQKSGSHDSSATRHSMAPLDSVLTGLEGFDYKAVQRKLGLHVDAGTGQATDLRLCQSMLQLLTRVRNDILPKLIPANGNPRQFVSYNQLRDEARFFEHSCHFLENLYIRNEKTNLATVLAKRLYDTGRGFKGFNVNDKKQWDLYVQCQIESSLLKEQRRAARSTKPPALFSFQVMANLKLGRTDWAELQLESENFPSHTHTIGDYRPEASLGTDSNQVRSSFVSRRTGTLRSVLPGADKPSSDNDQTTAMNRKDKLHPQPDCLCRLLILYKGRDVVDMQSMFQIKALYLVAGSNLSLIQSPHRNNTNGGPEQTGSSYQDQAWSLRRYHQGSYPYLCVVEFKDGLCSEYLFKDGAERTAFAIMCSDFRNDIAVYQQINLARSPRKASEPIQCDICSRKFGIFAKRSMCKLCYADICKVCSEKISAPELDLSYIKPIRLCKNCTRARTQENQKMWPKRLWFERAVSAAYSSKIMHTLDVCISSLETQSGDLRLSLRPVESPTKFSDRTTISSACSPLRSIASMPAAHTNRTASGTRLSHLKSDQDVAPIILRHATSEEDNKSHHRAVSRSPSFQKPDASVSDDKDASGSGQYNKPLRFKTRRVVASGNRSTQSAGILTINPQLAADINNNND